MNMKKLIPSIVLSFLMGSTPNPAYSIGLALRFVDITLENVDPGSSFNLRVARNLPLVVINQDEERDAEIVVEVVPPQAKEMKDGYEPIPDPSWVRVVPNRFKLGPKASASADVLVDIPTDRRHVGHHYEVIIWVHTDQRNRVLMKNGVIYQVGLRSRLRISIGTPGPAALQREKLLKKLAEINVNFSVNPDNIYVQNVGIGKTVDLKPEKKTSLKVVNQADDAVKLKLTSISADENISPQSGYEYAPDPKWLVILPETVAVAGNTIKEVKMQLTVPNKPEYRSKKYAFLIRTTLSDESLPLAYNNMVYVTTEP